MSELLDRQMLFTRLLASLIQRANSEPGYACAGRELQRSPEQAALNQEAGVGTQHSCHIRSLAIDLELYRRQPDGSWKWLTESEDYRWLGDWWTEQSRLCRWGGSFNRRPDGNHFSILSPEGWA